MATRFLISAKRRPRRLVSSRFLPTSPCPSRLIRRPACEQTAAKREKYRSPKEGGKKRDEEIARLRKQEESERCGGNGERTRETTEAHGAEGGRGGQSNFFQASAFRGASFPFLVSRVSAKSRKIRPSRRDCAPIKICGQDDL